MHRHHPQRVRVLIVDDHAPSTDRIKEMVAPNFEVVATVRAIGEQALRLALELKPDVILINIATIKDRSQGVTEIIRQLPHTRVIFYQDEGGCRSCAAKVSSHAASTLGRCGFAGSSPANCGFSVLPIDVELKPNNHRTPISGKASDCASQTPETPSSRELTDREYEVLALLAAGHPMKRIAYRLGITYRTVTFHKYRMMERLGITTNAGLMSYALKRNISERFENNETAIAA